MMTTPGYDMDTELDYKITFDNYFNIYTSTTISRAETISQLLTRKERIELEKNEMYFCAFYRALELKDLDLPEFILHEFDKVIEYQRLLLGPKHMTAKRAEFCSSKSPIVYNIDKAHGCLFDKLTFPKDDITFISGTVHFCINTVLLLAYKLFRRNIFYPEYKPKQCDYLKQCITINILHLACFMIHMKINFYDYTFAYVLDNTQFIHKIQLTCIYKEYGFWNFTDYLDLLVISNSYERITADYYNNQQKQVLPSYVKFTLPDFYREFNVNTQH